MSTVTNNGKRRMRAAPEGEKPAWQMRPSRANAERKAQRDVWGQEIPQAEPVDPPAEYKFQVLHSLKVIPGGRDLAGVCPLDLIAE